MRGRKPVPTVLKVLRGNPGKRRLNDREPMPGGAKPRCPSHLNGAARQEWHWLARRLHEIGLLTAIDRDMLAAYCECKALRDEALAVVAKSNLLIKNVQGNLVPNPLLGIANRALAQMARIASEFGMTPGSRTRIRIEKPEAEDELSAFLKRKERDGTDG